MKNQSIFLSIMLFMTGCYTNTSVQLPVQTNNSIKPSVSLIVNVTPTPIVTPSIQIPSPSPTDKVIQSGLTNDTKPTPIPSTTAYMCVSPGAIKDSNGNIISPAGSPSSSNCWSPDDFKPSPPPYSNNQPIPENYKDGQIIGLTFKDEYKIRPRDHEQRIEKTKLMLQYRAENKPLSIYLPEVLESCYVCVTDLISLSGADTSKLNSLLKQYNIIIAQSGYNFVTQEQADKDEIFMDSKYPDEDFPNRYSEYSLRYKDIDLVKFLTELRNLDIVREANYHDQTITVD